MVQNSSNGNIEKYLSTIPNQYIHNIYCYVFKLISIILSLQEIDMSCPEIIFVDSKL